MLMVYSLMSRKIPFWDLSCADVNFECSCCIKCLHSGCKPSLVAALSAKSGDRQVRLIISNWRHSREVWAI